MLEISLDEGGAFVCMHMLSSLTQYFRRDETFPALKCLLFRILLTVQNNLEKLGCGKTSGEEGKDWKKLEMKRREEMKGLFQALGAVPQEL